MTAAAVPTPAVDVAAVTTDRTLRMVAIGAAALAQVLVVTAAVLHVTWSSRGFQVEPLPSSDIVLGTLFPLAGALVLWHRPRNAAGWVLMSGGLVAVSTLAHQWASIGAVADPGSLPVVEAAIWLSAWTYVPYWVQPALLPVLFPDGRLPSERWRLYVRVTLTAIVVLTLVSMFKLDDDVEGLGGLSNPLGFYASQDVIPPVVWAVTQFTLSLGLWLVATPIALVGLLRRQRAAAGVERAQLQWLLLGFTTCFALAVFSTVGVDALFAAGFAAIPLCVGVAVLRHGMFDVEVVVNRTILYVLLTGVGVLTYVVLVALAGRYVGSSGVGPVVAALVVAGAASGRSRLQQLLDRRLFGARRDPYAVVEMVSASTAAAQQPLAALQAVVDAVREALRLPYVQVIDADGEVTAEAGRPVAGTHVFPVVDRGRRLGALVVGRRSRNERLRPEEDSALHDVARRAGALLSAHELQADLQLSYERTVLAREEERRRLRRDLHDGVGPALAGMALQLDSLAGRLDGEPELAVRAAALRDRMRGTVSEIRHIIDGLRPAAIDELGLAEALRQLSSDPGTTPTVVVAVDLPAELPAAVELAAYRIAGEAVANAVRHASASTVWLTASVVDEHVHLEVTDDGRGFGATATAGVGLSSLHDRAAEVGGSLTVESAPAAGTRVTARLPLALL